MQQSYFQFGDNGFLFLHSSFLTPIFLNYDNFLFEIKLKKNIFLFMQLALKTPREKSTKIYIKSNVIWTLNDILQLE
jgi:hypothetical protein